MSSEIMKKILGEKPAPKGEVNQPQTPVHTLTDEDLRELVDSVRSNNFSKKSADLIATAFGIPRDKMFFKDADEADEEIPPCGSSCPDCEREIDQADDEDLHINVLENLDLSNPAAVQNDLALMLMKLYRTVGYRDASAVAHNIWFDAA